MTIKEAKDYLISLIERDTPKKVEIGTSEYFEFPSCPNCKVEFNEYYKRSNKYCKECGQRLDWSELDELKQQKERIEKRIKELENE